MKRIQIKVLTDFYKKKCNLTYKRITIRPPKIPTNYHVLTDWLELIEKKLDKGYLLFSLDETSFGITDLRRYGWGIKG